MRYIAFILFYIGGSFLFGQKFTPSFYDNSENNWENRWEGTKYKKNTSSPFIRLVSLTAQKDDISSGQEQVLKVRYNSPESGFFLLRSEKLDQKFYGMEAYQNETKKGWRTWEPWPVDDVLGRENISIHEIGITAKIGSVNSSFFLPVWVYHTDWEKESDSYSAIFQFGRNFSGGNYRLYRGTEPNEQLEIKETRVTQKSVGTPWRKIIPFSLLPNEGWYTIELNLSEKGRAIPHTYAFSFFHKK